jgi:pteridine reductase
MASARGCVQDNGFRQGGRMPETRPVALVTGSARRVGAVIARTLHRAGFDLVLHHRRSGAESEALRAELEAARAASTLPVQGDFADPAAPSELVAAALAHFGRLDALVNNASAFYPTPIGAVDGKQWDDLFASNARAPFFLSQAAAPHLRAAGGAIVNLLDVYAERPLPGHTLYCMAKSALAAMTLSLAQELAPEVRVNGVAPGAVLWPEADDDDARRRAIVERTPLRRVGTPEDVAEAVRWLLQDARYTTGQILRVDGGRSLTWA